MTRPRAAIVVTGSELVRGDREDRNGPFLAAEAVRVGLDSARIAIVGDRVDDLERAFREGFEADICLVSGGLGPTHDDRTLELVSRVAGRPLVLDEELEREIGSISRAIAERLGRTYAEFATGVRKQATLPEGAISLGLAGTAPGVVLDTGSCVVVVLPGPPRELRRLWPRALETEPVRKVLARAPSREHRVLRFFGTPESSVAEALAAAGGEGDGVDVTICAREFEIHVDLFIEPSSEERGASVAASMRDALAPYLFGEDERSISEIVLGLCRARGLTLATAESCTGGMVASRLTSVPGASDVFVGAVVAYADEVKEAELGVPVDLIASARCRLRRGRRVNGGRGARAPRCRRRGRRHRHRRPWRRHGREARRARVRSRYRAGWREDRPHRAPGRSRDDPRARDGRCAASRSSIVGESTHGHVSSRATVESDDHIRLFLALELPDDVVADFRRWGAEHLVRGRRLDVFHVTLAFLGSQPRAVLEPIAEILRQETGATEPFRLEPVRYRETRSVGMLVLADPSGRATSLADRVQRDLERLGVYERERRPWLPHVAVLRFRERPRLDPPLPGIGSFAPSEAAALLSRLHPSGARYEVLESCSLGRVR